MTALSTELPALRALPMLRLLPAPSHQPPYDDELPVAPVLRLVTPPLVAAPTLRVVPAPACEADDLDVALWLAARRTPTAELPAAVPFARTLVQGLLEVLAGVRPLRQLQRDTTPELYAVLERVVARQRAPAGPRPGGRAVRSCQQLQHLRGARRPTPGRGGPQDSAERDAVHRPDEQQDQPPDQRVPVGQQCR